MTRPNSAFERTRRQSLGVWLAVGTLACAAGIVPTGIGAEALLRRFAAAALLPGGG